MNTTHGGANKMTTEKTRTALDAYMEHHSAALALVERIHEAIASHDVSPDPESINWGHVGDLAVTAKALRKIADRTFEEGEYAPLPAEQCIVCGDVFVDGYDCACADR
jgi:hypothetical protein